MIRLSKSSLGNEEKEAVVNVLIRGYLGMGMEVKRFEEELKDFFGGKMGVACVNTGTAALHLAVQSLGIGHGDEVIVPSITYVASFQAITATGATPVACDVLERNALIDVEDAKRRITKKTKAVMPVHYASEPGDLNRVYALAEEYGLRVIEDAAQAFGSGYGQRRIGEQGDIVCFSFDGIKNITSGEGGAVVTADPVVLKKVCDARLLGVQNDSEQRFKNQRSWEFDVVEQGWRYHMSDIMAAIGRVQLRRLVGEFAPRRKCLVNLYRNHLKGSRHLRLLENDPERTVPHIFPVRILDGKRDFVRKRLLENEIQVGIHYLPNHLLSKFGAGAISLPVCERLYTELLTLPLHVDLTESEVERVCSLIQNALEEQ